MRPAISRVALHNALPQSLDSDRGDRIVPSRTITGGGFTTVSEFRDAALPGHIRLFTGSAFYRSLLRSSPRLSTVCRSGHVTVVSLECGGQGWSGLDSSLWDNNRSQPAGNEHVALSMADHPDMISRIGRAAPISSSIPPIAPPFPGTGKRHWQVESAEGFGTRPQRFAVN